MRDRGLDHVAHAVAKLQVGARRRRAERGQRRERDRIEDVSVVIRIVMRIARD